MKTPLIQQPRVKPLVALFKREGWVIPLLLLTFIRTMHGLPAAFHAIFLVRKSDIQSHEPVYSRYDLWILHSGLISFISATLLLGIIVRYIRVYRATETTSEQVGDGDAEEAV